MHSEAHEEVRKMLRGDVPDYVEKWMDEAQFMCDGTAGGQLTTKDRAVLLCCIKMVMGTEAVKSVSSKPPAAPEEPTAPVEHTDDVDWREVPKGTLVGVRWGVKNPKVKLGKFMGMEGTSLLIKIEGHKKPVSRINPRKVLLNSNGRANV